MNDEEEQGKQSEEQGSRKSSVDKINNLVDKSRSAYNKAKTAKKIYNTARRARAVVAVGQVAAGTAPVWLPIVLITVGILFFIFLVSAIIMIFTGNAKGGEPPPSTICQEVGGTCEVGPTQCSTGKTPDSTATCSEPALPLCCVAQRQCTDITDAECSSSLTCADVEDSQPDPSAICNDPANPTKTTCCVPKSNLVCDPDDPIKSLKDNFNITAVGSSDKPLLDFICRVYLEHMAPHPHYLSMFRSRSVTYTFINSPGPNGAHAITQGSGDVTYFRGFINASASFKEHTLVHESGHIIAGAEPFLQINLYNETYNSDIDLECFNLNVGILKTYPWRVLPSVTMRSRINETFAESLADSLICPATGTCKGNGGGAAPIQDFRTTCDNIYNYIITLVL